MLKAEDIQKIAENAYIRENEPMSKHTTFRIGGPAQLYIEPDCVESFCKIVRFLKENGEKYFIIGNGSNLLVKDEGYNGVIISTRVNASNKKNQNFGMGDYKVYLSENEASDKAERERFITEGYITSDSIAGKNLVFAASGIILAKLANVIAENELTGFEFAGGIPGTLGGAVTMNAGAYGGEIKDCILAARVMLADGSIKVLSKEELKLSYRSSIIQKEDMVVLDALFGFDKGNKEDILSTMRELNEKRRDKQPLEYGSAGSTFKRPEGYFAAKLIEDAGLKGYSSGDVMVSEKHSGFVVNTGNGKYADAMNVIEHVKKTVADKFGVELELEVKIL